MKQLKPINVDAYVMSDVQAEVDDQTKQSFQSLLDDAARMTQTCATNCIYAALPAERESTNCKKTVPLSDS